MNICQNSTCEEELIGKRSSARYCGAKCKTEAYILNKAKSLSGVVTPISLPTSGLPSDAQFIIKTLERDRHKLESQLTEALQSKKKFKSKYEEEREKFKDHMQEMKLRDLQRDLEKPEGLSGFIETHGEKMMAIAPEVVPRILTMLEKFAFKGSGGQQIGGIPQATNDVAQQIITWLSELDEDHSRFVMQLLTDMNTKTGKDKEASIQLITQLLNVIKNGTLLNQA